ncbi:MAG: type II toxin-antitoxin system VapC family toxin [Akkermansiaceae bacterium]|nr:type II toxin-antitoxin system VapC family toxin [Akkermansiaceae bacterium]
MPAVVDSSGWIEFFTDGPNSIHFAAAIQATSDLVVPAISITEVYRWILRESSLSHALTAAAAMKQGRVVPLDERLAVIAAEISHRHQLPLADGIIYATARDASAELLTQDSDLDGLPGVTYIRHPNRKS